MKKTLKSSIFLVLANICDFFIIPTKLIKPKTILIIKQDGIGDYILFRNFIELIFKSPKYKNYSITLIGNNSYKDLAEEIDKNFVNQFIWINRKKMIKNPFYRFKNLKFIASKGYEIILHPTYSRDFILGDRLVKLISGKFKLGFKTDLSNITNYHRRLSNSYYDSLITLKEQNQFEFLRYRQFFEDFLDLNLTIKKPYIKNYLKPKNLNLPSKFVIFAIGANDSFRRWPIEKYAKIANWIKKIFGFEIVICGSSIEKQLSETFTSLVSGNVINLVGKISLNELLFVIDRSQLLITNETSIPHMAVALNFKNFIVISNANHYGRFTPYPKEIFKKYSVILPERIAKLKEDQIVKHYINGSDVNISEISCDTLKEEIKKFLDK